MTNTLIRGAAKLAAKFATDGSVKQVGAAVSVARTKVGGEAVKKVRQKVVSSVKSNTADLTNQVTSKLKRDARRALAGNKDLKDVRRGVKTLKQNAKSVKKVGKYALGGAAALTVTSAVAGTVNSVNTQINTFKINKRIKARLDREDKILDGVARIVGRVDRTSKRIGDIPKDAATAANNFKVSSSKKLQDGYKYVYGKVRRVRG